MQITYTGDCNQLKNLKKELSPKVTMAKVLRCKLSEIQVGEEFHMFKLAQKVRDLIGEERGEPCFMYSGSILRQLREERAEGRFNYECINRPKSIYKRISGGSSNEN
jgi:hypothetical protein